MKIKLLAVLILMITFSSCRMQVSVTDKETEKNLVSDTIFLPINEKFVEITDYNKVLEVYHIVTKQMSATDTEEFYFLSYYDGDYMKRELIIKEQKGLIP